MKSVAQDHLRSRILSVSRQLQQQGSAEFSMRRLAQHVGCCPGAIYYHFRSKQELLGAVHQEALEKLAQQLQDCRSTAPLNPLVPMSQLLLNFACNYPTSFDALFSGIHAPASCREQESAADQVVQMQFIVAIRQYVGSQDQTCQLVRLLTSLVWYFLYGLAIQYRENNKSTPQHDLPVEIILSSFFPFLKLLK